MDFQHDSERAIDGFDPPTVLVNLFNGHRLAADFGHQGQHVASKVADQITAGYPGRQRQPLTRWVRRLNGQGHMKAMRRRFCGLNPVVQWRQGKPLGLSARVV